MWSLFTVLGSLSKHFLDEPFKTHVFQVTGRPAPSKGQAVLPSSLGRPTPRGLNPSPRSPPLTWTNRGPSRGDTRRPWRSFLQVVHFFACIHVHLAIDQPSATICFAWCYNYATGKQTTNLSQSPGQSIDLLFVICLMFFVFGWHKMQTNPKMLTLCHLEWFLMPRALEFPTSRLACRSYSCWLASLRLVQLFPCWYIYMLYYIVF